MQHDDQQSVPAGEKSQSVVLRSVIFSFLWLACAWYLTGTFAGGPLWQVLLAVSFLALPLVTFTLYQRIVHKTLRRVKYRPDSLLYRFFSGRLLSLAFALTAGFIGGVFLLVPCSCLLNC